MTKQKFLSQVALPNTGEEDLMKVGPNDSSSSQFNNALQSTGAFKLTRFSLEVTKAEQDLATEAEEVMRHNQNSSIGVAKLNEPLSPFFNLNTSTISFFDKSARMSATGVFEDTLRESNYEAVLA